MRKYPLITILALVVSFLSAQNQKKIDAILAEGKLLYYSEMASWLGTDLFLSEYTQRENIGGYLSYSEDHTARCIFFDHSAEQKVLGTVTFDLSFGREAAVIDIQPRLMSEKESTLLQLRNRAAKVISEGSFVVSYENTGLNIIPLSDRDGHRVYILTAPKDHGVVLFGNDYLLEFDSKLRLKSKKKLHQNLIPVGYQSESDASSSVHSHLPETGHYITATDVCTLMLYCRYTDWESHHVISDKYLNMWDCATNRLSVVSTKAIMKIKDQ